MHTTLTFQLSVALHTKMCTGTFKKNPRAIKMARMSRSVAFRHRAFESSGGRWIVDPGNQTFPTPKAPALPAGKEMVVPPAYYHPGIGCSFFHLFPFRFLLGVDHPDTKDARLRR